MQKPHEKRPIQRKIPIFPEVLLNELNLDVGADDVMPLLLTLSTLRCLQRCSRKLYYLDFLFDVLHET